MTPRSNQTKLTLYRRHASTCPVQDTRVLDGCECPFWIHGKLAGKFIRRALDTRSLTSADQKKRLMIAGAQETPVTGLQLATTPQAMTLECAAAEFLEASKRLSQSSQKLYRRATTQFTAWAHQKNLYLLSEIQNEHIRAFLDHHSKIWKRNTRQCTLVHMRVWFNWCCRTKHWIPFPPSEDRTLNQHRGNKREATSDRKPFAPAEITRILAAVEKMPKADRDRARAVVLLLLYTGMRISDATFFERSFLTERNTADYYVIKTRHQIALPPEVQRPALAALAKLPASRIYFFWPDREDDFHEARQALREGEEFSTLMPNYAAKVRSMTLLVKKVLALAGLSGACHKFRDTFAINLLVGGTDVYTVSKMLGHSDVKITDSHYLKLVPHYREKMSQSTRRLAYEFPLTA